MTVTWTTLNSIIVSSLLSWCVSSLSLCDPPAIVSASLDPRDPSLSSCGSQRAVRPSSFVRLFGLLRRWCSSSALDRLPNRMLRSRCRRLLLRQIPTQK